MKVATVILAIAVASVSAKVPAEKPLHFDNEPAVRANLGEAGHLAADSVKYTAHAAADLAREAQANVLAPSANVAVGTTTGTAHKAASYGEAKTGDMFGALSAVQKKLAQASEKVTNYLYNSAATNSRRYESYHGAKADHDAAASERFEQASAPLRHGAENVKNAAVDAKEKVVDIKNDAAAKLQARKEEAEAHAEHAKDKTADHARASGNKIKGSLSSLAGQFGRGTQKVGEGIEHAGEKVKETGANIRERNDARANEEFERANLILEERSGASTIAMSSAAIAVASAAAVYLI